MQPNRVCNDEFLYLSFVKISLRKQPSYRYTFKLTLLNKKKCARVVKCQYVISFVNKLF